MFSIFRPRGTANDIAALPAPWAPDATSLRERIARAFASRTSDDDSIQLEPDTPHDPDTIRYADGLRDALFGGDEDTPSKTNARSLVAALGRLVRRPEAVAFRHFHDLLADADVLGVIDEFLPRVIEQRLPSELVAAVARRVASQSPDLAAVKLAIGLLGVCSTDRDLDLVLELGRYEELTLYSAVAVTHMTHAIERPLWTLAQGAVGWGRIQVVRRLTDVRDPEIRAWLLREGYSNSIMVEETAYHCAVEGGLLDALRDDQPDDALLKGAGELIEALIDGGPAEDIDDYADGAEVCALYLAHLARRPATDLRTFLHVQAIRRFEGDADGPWSERERRGWTAARRLEIRAAAGAYLARPEWLPLAEAGLQLEARRDYWPAAAVARALGVDVWPHHFRRQRDLGVDHWWELMQTDSEERVLQILDLAYERLDLSLVGSGPGTSLGLGPDYENDSAVDFILQDLRRFPGLGWTIIEVGLRARTIRARNMAHKALAAWDRAQWPTEAEALLRTALAKEPDAEVAERIEALIAGRFPKDD